MQTIITNKTNTINEQNLIIESNNQHLDNIKTLLENINKKHQIYSSINKSIDNFVDCEFIKIKKKINKINNKTNNNTPNQEWAKYIHK